jgi:hypothetical protein
MKNILRILIRSIDWINENSNRLVKLKKKIKLKLNTQN